MTQRAKVHLVLWPSAFVAGLVGTLVVIREPTEPLTPSALNAARQQWRDSAVVNYDLSFAMHGSIYAVQIREGLVVHAEVNGRKPLTADLEAYSMDGLFDLLEQELENSAGPAGSLGSSAGRPLLRVRFNSKLGYIEKYLRSASSGMRGAAIELTHFARVS